MRRLKNQVFKKSGFHCVLNCCHHVNKGTGNSPSGSTALTDKNSKYSVSYNSIDVKIHHHLHHPWKKALFCGSHTVYKPSLYLNLHDLYIKIKILSVYKTKCVGEFTVNKLYG